MLTLKIKHRTEISLRFKNLRQFKIVSAMYVFDLIRKILKFKFKFLAPDASKCIVISSIPNKAYKKI